MKSKTGCRLGVLAAALAACAFSAGAYAQTDNEALKQQIDALQRQINDLKAAMERGAAPAPTPSAPPPATERSMRTPVGADSYVELYGHLDLSADDITKGLSGKVQDGVAAGGKTGWQPDLSSNLSRIGVRGARKLGDTGLRGIFQIETQVDVSATPGESTVPDNTIKGAFASRNSFLGFAGGFGAIKAGKTDAPYKLATGRMDPFSATVGDYNAIMGNTGGDNRAEFDTRLSHSIWYESPKMGGLRINALFSPGQNRASDNSVTASGEPDCTGGNQPPCTDGAFGNVYSASAVWESGPIYAIAAYEVHKDVNRQGDDADGGGTAPAGAVGIADERAWKVGLQYKFPTRTTLSAIYERMTRNARDPASNERQRNGYWLALTQKFSPMDDFNLGWAHAGKTLGDPIQGPVDNESNLYSIGYKHHFDRQTTWYAVYARQANHSGAHFDLGASGHGITTDCKDYTGFCFFGGTLQAFSLGATYDF
jgi:predicted porin